MKCCEDLFPRFDPQAHRLQQALNERTHSGIVIRDEHRGHAGVIRPLRLWRGAQLTEARTAALFGLYLVGLKIVSRRSTASSSARVGAAKSAGRRAPSSCTTISLKRLASST